MEEDKTTVITETPQTESVQLMPLRFGDKYKMSQILAKSGLLPQGLNTPEKVCVALQWGHELGLTPMVACNNIAVVNGKPTLGADIMNAIVRKSPEYGGIEWECLDSKKAICIVTRKGNGYTEKTRSEYTWEMATAAGLVNKDNWKKYPVRMLKHRALSYALRDAFPDLLAGVYNPEEMEATPKAEIKPEEPINITTDAEVKTVEENSVEKSEPKKAKAETKVSEEKKPDVGDIF